MLDDLVQAIETLKQRIREHGPYVGAYESRTRVSLIDPMLSALGWDVADPGVVEIEPRIGRGWADYLLIGANGKPVVFLEAKKLDERESPLSQMVGYAITANIENQTSVRYCAYSNGDLWEMYDIISQSRVMRTSITSGPAEKVALQMLGLWRGSLGDGSYAPANEPVVAAAVAEASTAAQETTAAQMVAEEAVPPATEATLPQHQRVVVESVITQPPGADWTPLTGDFPTNGHPAPAEIRLPDGTIKAAKSWRSVMVETALWLFQEGVLTRDSCPIPMGGTRHLLSLDGLHRSGSRFHSPVSIAQTGIILEGSINPKDIVHHARKLWLDFGQDPAQVHLKLK